MTHYSCLLYQVTDHIAIITLNRPERLNALNGTLLEELRDAMRAARADEEVRVIIVTGSPRVDGRPCFSAGDDLKAFAEGIPMSPSLGSRLMNTIDDMLKPTIAVIDGPCSTGAVELALAFDFRLVGEQVKISDLHLKALGLGLGGWGASTRWAKLVGVQKAKEILLTGKTIEHFEACQIGFALSAHPSDQLMDAALELAGTIASMHPEGVRITMAHLSQVEDMSRDQALRYAELLPEWFSFRGDLHGHAERFAKKKPD